MRKLLIKDPKKNKLVLCGFIDNKTMYRDVKSNHFMRVVGGYGIQEGAFEQLLDRQIEDIILRETDTGKKWESKTPDWMQHGRVADYGHGKQRFLSIKYMKGVKSDKK